MATFPQVAGPPEHCLWQCQDGKIRNYWEYVDTLYAQRVLFDD
jgi:ketosteroid isomerase-like protein